MAQNALAQVVLRRNVDATAVPPTAVPRRGRDHLAQRREIGHPHLNLPFDFQPNQHAIKGHAAHERFRAVYRVNKPAMGRPGGFGHAILFADDGMARVTRLDATANELFRSLVGNGNGGVVRFPIRPYPVLKVAQSEPPRFPREFSGKI